MAVEHVRVVWARDCGFGVDTGRVLVRVEEGEPRPAVFGPPGFHDEGAVRVDDDGDEFVSGDWLECHCCGWPQLDAR